MDAPIVSVVIPVHNCAKHICSAVDSALAQDVPLEIIVLDDCSTDDLDRTMQRYKHEPRVIYLKNNAHLGVAQTRNRGVALAKGKYIAFLDADDNWMPGKLQRQLDLLAQTGTVLCSTARELMLPDGTLTGTVLHTRKRITYRSMLLQNQINCSATVILTKVAREFPMAHDDCHEDYLMWLQVLRKYRTACAIDAPLLKYRVSSSGKSGTKLHSAKLTYRVYQYMGYSLPRSLLQFVSYMLHGLIKYFRWFIT